MQLSHGEHCQCHGLVGNIRIPRIVYWDGLVGNIRLLRIVYWDGLQYTVTEVHTTLFIETQASILSAFCHVVHADISVDERSSGVLRDWKTEKLTSLVPGSKQLSSRSVCEPWESMILVTVKLWWPERTVETW